MIYHDAHFVNLDPCVGLQLMPDLFLQLVNDLRYMNMARDVDVQVNRQFIPVVDDALFVEHSFIRINAPTDDMLHSFCGDPQLTRTTALRKKTVLFSLLSPELPV